MSNLDTRTDTQRDDAVRTDQSRTETQREETRSDTTTQPPPAQAPEPTRPEAVDLRHGPRCATERQESRHVKVAALPQISQLGVTSICRWSQ